MAAAFKWPLRYHPEIFMAVRVPFSAARMAREYQQSTFALHQHYYRGRVTIGKSTFDLQPGDLTISPPELISRYELQDSGYHWCVHFQPAIFVPGEPTLSLPLHLSTHAHPYVNERLRAIVETSDSRLYPRAARPLAATTAGTLLQNLLLQLALDLRHHPGPSPQLKRKSDALLEAAKENMDRQFSRPLTVADLARASGLSRNYFSARFRARFGMTVDAYLLHRRIEMAKMLLNSTSLSIKEIAYECGIPDSHYFNKQFRRATGESPTSYRVKS